MNIILNIKCKNDAFNYIVVNGDIISKTLYYQNMVECDGETFISINNLEYQLYNFILDFDKKIVVRYLYGEYNIDLIELMLFLMDSRCEEIVEKNLIDILENKHQKYATKIYTIWPELFSNMLEFLKLKFDEESELFENSTDSNNLTNFLHSKKELYDVYCDNNQVIFTMDMQILKHPNTDDYMYFFPSYNSQIILKNYFKFSGKNRNIKIYVHVENSFCYILIDKISNVVVHSIKYKIFDINKNFLQEIKTSGGDCIREDYYTEIYCFKIDEITENSYLRLFIECDNQIDFYNAHWIEGKGINLDDTDNNSDVSNDFSYCGESTYGPTDDQLYCLTDYGVKYYLHEEDCAFGHNDPINDYYDNRSDCSHDSLYEPNEDDFSDNN